MSLPNRRLSLEYICNHCSFEMNQENHLHPTQFSFNSCEEKGKPASGGRGSARHMTSRSRISQPTAAHLRCGTLEVVALRLAHAPHAAASARTPVTGPCSTSTRRAAPLVRSDCTVPLSARSRRLANLNHQFTIGVPYPSRRSVSLASPRAEANVNFRRI
jgi:hypothetical protein